MSASRCPIASPFAWSSARDSGCTRTAYCFDVPANDSPQVRLPRLAGPAVPEAVALGGLASVGEARGVAISCPLPRPFAWSPAVPVLLLPPAHLPAKEKKNKQQETTLPLGGEP